MKILYIGGFEMPDKNAAAQRVLSIAKALRLLGHEVEFYGITKSGDTDGQADGFHYEACIYPQSTRRWIAYASGKGVEDYLRKSFPDMVITYNYPALAQERVIRYCHKHGIPVVGDITEWYKAHNAVKWVDTTLRMRWSNRHLDGIIAISRYLDDYYSGQHTLLLPPLVDKEESKWKQTSGRQADGKIRLIYVGSPGVGKDRLDYIIRGISAKRDGRLTMDVVGITEDQFRQIYGGMEVAKELVRFHGRLPHKEAVGLLMQSDFQVFFRDSIRVNNAGFPTKFVESISAGIPVISNRISNIADFIIDGQNSFLIEEPSEEQIIQVLDRVGTMSDDEVIAIKANCETRLFDYHNYIGLIDIFIKEIKH